MKTVHIFNGTVREVLPEEAHPTAAWYGDLFAAQCVDAPDEVAQGWLYDADTGEFSPPIPGSAESPSTDQDARLTALETETAAISAAIERGLSL